MINIDKSFIPVGWEEKHSMIKVIGVGGGGTNAVNQMYRDGIKDVDFMVCNTDKQALYKSPVDEKLQLGEKLTEGLGAGCNPEQGRKAALESTDIIKEKLSRDTKMVFITAGMGGGTGTGAAPVIAKVAKDMGILIVGVVTQPFKDEGYEFLRRAYEGIQELAKNVDSLLIIDNQKLYEIYGDLTVSEAFPKADSVLSTAVKGIAEIITGSGLINVDFADVKMVMKNSGMALMGTGIGSGENRIHDAVEQVFKSPLLNEYDLKTAKSVLVNISSNTKKQLKMSEIKQAIDYIQEYTGRASNFKRGMAFDKNLGEDAIRITVVATGINMIITPPPVKQENVDKIPLNDNNDDIGSEGILLYDNNDDSNEVPLNITSSYDSKYTTIYTSDMKISDLENEAAYTRRMRTKAQLDKLELEKEK